MTNAGPEQLTPGEYPSLESAEEAVRRLFPERNRLLVAYIAVRVQSEQEAKEVAQEAYARLLQIPGQSSPAFWRNCLFKIATNLAVDRLRHRQVQRQTEEALASFDAVGAVSSEMQDPAERWMAREQAARILEHLQELPGRCREVFVCHRIEGLQQGEVAARMGISTRMVRRYVTYAMVYCQLRLDGVPAKEAQSQVTL